MGNCISKPPNSQNRLSTINFSHSPVSEIDYALDPKKKIKKSDQVLLLSSLKNHFLFADLFLPDLERVYCYLKYFSLPSNEIIFKQGDQGKRFYIIDSGQVEVIRDNQKKIVLTKGNTFGENSLVTDEPRRATLVTLQETKLWGLSRSGFLLALQVVYQRNYEINKTFISKLNIFAGFSYATKDLLTKSCIQHTYPDNYRIICEEDPGSMLFILKEGSAVAKVKGVEKYRIRPSEMFGESVLIHPESLRKESVFSVGNTQCLSIDKESMVRILGGNIDKIIFRTIAKHSISSDKLLGMLSDENINMIVDEMEWIPCENGDNICNPDIGNDFIFCIVFGKFASADLVFDSCQAFGLSNQNIKKIRGTGLVAAGQGVIGMVNSELIGKVTQSSCRDLKVLLKLSKFLAKIEFLSSMPMKSLKYLSTKTRLIEYDQGETIYQVNDKADCFYIIKKGKVNIFDKRKKERILHRLDIFGESCIREDTRNKTAVAVNSCFCVEIPAKEFLKLSDLAEVDRINSRKSIASLFTLNQVVKIKTLNRNYYKLGIKATLVESKQYYYVVVINKNTVDSIDICHQIVQSKNVALNSEHPLLTKHIKSFIDESFVYIFYEYISFFPFTSIPETVFTEKYTRFIAACLVFIIEYLHSKDIIYRNICPNNIGIIGNGYVVLTSFSPAAVGTIPNKFFSSSSIYSAPEMHESKTYSKAADLWSLGIIIYRYLYKKFPYGMDESDSDDQIFSKCLSNQLEFPKEYNYFKAEELLKTLLHRSPKKRTTIKEIKYMKWFVSTDWRRISSQTYLPEYIPIITENSENKKKLISLQRYVHVRIT